MKKDKAQVLSHHKGDALRLFSLTIPNVFWWPDEHFNVGDVVEIIHDGWKVFSVRKIISKFF